MTADELWKKSGLSGTYEAWSFSEAPDKLADLVLQKIKTAKNITWLKTLGVLTILTKALGISPKRLSL